jgi:hypothetical protein
MRCLSALLLLALGLSPQVRAQQLWCPNGNPTGSIAWVGQDGRTVQTYGDSGPGGPASYVRADAFDWGAVLARLGFTGTVQFQWANGFYTLGTDYVWANSHPLIQQGIKSIDAATLPGEGGAAFGLSWTGYDSPDKWQNWIQLVRTNADWVILPSYARPVKNWTGWFTYDLVFIDSWNGPNGNPFYDSGGNAGYASLVDCAYAEIAQNSIGMPTSGTEYWMFYTFKAYRPDPNTIVIAEEGVSWGYIIQ